MNAVVALADLAAAINSEHSAAVAHAHSAVQRARQAGELLIQAKAQMAHGQWLPWVRANVPDIAERTVHSYMRLATYCLENPGAMGQLESLTLRGAIAKIAAPRPATKSATAADLKKEVESLRATYHEAISENREAFQRQVSAEVQRLLPDQAHKEIEEAKEAAASARQLESIWRHRAETCVRACKLFHDNWRSLAGILHPDRAPPEKREQYAAAFDVVQQTRAALERTDLGRWS